MSAGPLQKCPSCGKGLRVPASAAGKKVRCPGCQSAFTVPAAPVAAPLPPEPLPLPPDPKPAKPTPKVPTAAALRKRAKPELPPVELKADERKLAFEGFSTPVAAYRVDSSRVTGAGCVMAFMVAAALMFLALGVFSAVNEDDGNLVVALILGGAAVGALALAGWMLARLGPGRRQRVLLYPEGVVIWRDGKPAAYRWDEIASVSTKRKDPGPQNRGMVRLAMMGGDFVLTVKFEDDAPVTLNALLLGVEDLALRIKDGLAAAEPDPEPDDAPPAAASGDPFANLF